MLLILFIVSITLILSDKFFVLVIYKINLMIKTTAIDFFGD
jgi:hypothetical protein